MQESLRGIQLLLQVLEVVENQVSFPLGAGLLEYCPDFWIFLDKNSQTFTACKVTCKSFKPLLHIPVRFSLKFQETKSRACTLQASGLQPLQMIAPAPNVPWQGWGLSLPALTSFAYAMPTPLSIPRSIEQIWT